jgi:hypothetical protein
MTGSNLHRQTPRRRPRSLARPAVRKRLLRVLLNGCSRDAAVAHARVHPRQFERWIERKEWFRRQVEDAHGKGEYRLVRQIKQSGEWRALSWLLERQYGQHYGNRPADVAQREKQRQDRAADERLKQRLLASLLEDDQEEPGQPQPPPESGGSDGT